MNAWKFSLVCLVLIASPTAAAGIDRDGAVANLAEFQQLCEADGGRLWGRSLCGKLMIVDPATRDTVTNSKPPEGDFAPLGTAFTGTLPGDGPVANTAIDWKGERWVQVAAPLPQSDTERRILIAHEAFHGIQPALGFSSTNLLSDHLGERDARVWFRLEADALRAALAADERDWRARARDALAFNRHRASLYPEAPIVEASLVNHEGLAEYTGVMLGGGDAADELARERLAGANTRESLVRSVGYVVGPAYGLLLDRTGMKWKEAALKGTPLPLLLDLALGGERNEADRLAERYGGPAIVLEETRRAEKAETELRELRAALVEGPVLILPFRQMNIGFDPNRVVALDDRGSVYTGAQIDDAWGSIRTEGRILVNTNWSAATVPLAAPPPTGGPARRWEGDGWVLTLAEGWRAVPGEREGDWTLEEVEGAPSG